MTARARRRADLVRAYAISDPTLTNAECQALAQAAIPNWPPPRTEATPPGPVPPADPPSADRRPSPGGED